MADFPTYANFPYTSDSGEELLDDLKTDRAVSGSAYTRVMYTGPKRRFSLRARVSQSVYSAQLLAHYLANRGASFNFTWKGDSTVYVCRYEAAPRLSYRKGALVDVECVLIEA